MPNSPDAGSQTPDRDGLLQAVFQNDVVGEGLFKAVARVESVFPSARILHF